MYPQILKFLSDESGAVTVDWVVLCAAVVGLGVGATAAVRSGAISLGGEIQTALGDAGVGLICQEGGDYALRILGGDRADETSRFREQIARMSDDELRAAYAETVEKTNILHAAGESADYVNEVLDYAYLYAQELEARRLEAPEGVQSFDALSNAIDGNSGRGACGTGGTGEDTAGDDDGGDGSHALLALDDEQARVINDELARYDDRSLAQLAQDLQEKYAEASSNRNREDMAMILDYMYLTYRALLDQNKNHEAIATALAAFNRLRDDYNSRHA